MTDADYKFMVHFVEQLGAVDTFVRALEGGGPGLPVGMPCVLFCTWRTRNAIELLGYVQKNSPAQGTPFMRRARGPITACVLIYRPAQQVASW